MVFVVFVWYLWYLYGICMVFVWYLYGICEKAQGQDPAPKPSKSQTGEGIEESARAELLGEAEVENPEDKAGKGKKKPEEQKAKHAERQKQTKITPWVFRSTYIRLRQREDNGERREGKSQKEEERMNNKTPMAPKKAKGTRSRRNKEIEQGQRRIDEIWQNPSLDKGNAQKQERNNKCFLKK